MLERFRLDGEVAVTMGGGNGIGRATAAALVETGAAVALFDRDEKAVKETEDALRAAGAEVEAYVGVFLGRGIATSNSNRFRPRWRSCRTCSHA